MGGIEWRFNVYSMTGMIVIFGIYYAPYVYMFTASALRNMDPALEEAAEISGASALRILLTVTFPLIAPAIISGMLLSFIVMLGIYGIPAVLGTPGDIPVLTTYIFKLTDWSPPLYSTAAAVAIILMVVTGFLVWLQQRVVSGRSYITVAGKAFRPGVMKLGALALFHARPRGRLSLRRRRAADARAARGRVPQVPVHPQHRKPVRHAAVFAHPFRAAVRQSARDALDRQHDGGRASSPRWSAACWHSRSATRSTARLCRAAGAIDVISTLPVAIPGLVIGVAYLWAWIGLPGGLYGTIWILALAFIARFMPDTIKALSTSLLQIHRELEEAAWICGKGLLGTIRTIVLPLARPGVIAR